MATTESKTPPLPTLNLLNVTLDDVRSVLSSREQALSVIKTWFASFSDALVSKDIEKLGLYEAASFWRDALCFSWDFRTFVGKERISKFIATQIKMMNIEDVKLKDLEVPWTGAFQPHEDIVWVQGYFTFSILGLGNVDGVFRLVPSQEGSWKAHSIFTSLSSLHEFPELKGPLRNTQPNHGLWSYQRAKEISFEDAPPTVLCIGGGQSGLVVAARLKALGVSCLVVEKNKRVGDNWRGRYESLCLHDPVWYDHMPYLPFPETWPVFAPAGKLADWLEAYTSIMELSVWTSSKVTTATPKEDGTWTVDIEAVGNEGRKRTFSGVKHVVFATGMGAGLPKMPDLPGLSDFKGQVLHSSQYQKAEDHKGKKVLVVGACTSAHDICSDYVQHGVDVTMYQRSSTYVISIDPGLKTFFAGLYDGTGLPTDVADLMNISFPTLFMERFAARQVLQLEEKDKELHDSLRARGFRLNRGLMDAGPLLSALSRAGGYYIDVGGSKLIAEGKIKLKNDAQISGFRPNGVIFDDGSFLEADVLIFATGYADPRTLVQTICSPEIKDKINPIWGLDQEGELKGVYRDLGVKGLWYMAGNLCLCRIYSKYLALQIKAMEEGLWDEKKIYSETPEM
ncbi:hypothetical protein DL96DRAFT_1683551 [Flagelloscypha sp. PMI_526]|nr:hypothetical protein DL96DRAFT_1683551 [Flagelloscypha sp. PMI_526]